MEFSIILFFSTTSNAQSLLLAQEVLLTMQKGPYRMLRIDPDLLCARQVRYLLYYLSSYKVSLFYYSVQINI